MLENAVIDLDVLDEACKPKNSGTWSVIRAGSVAVIRSVEWPGYTMFHRVETAVHGGVYIGDGLKNMEMSF